MKECAGARRQKVHSVFTNTFMADRDNPLLDFGCILQRPDGAMRGMYTLARIEEAEGA